MEDESWVGKLTHDPEDAQMCEMQRYSQSNWDSICLPDGATKRILRVDIARGKLSLNKVNYPYLNRNQVTRKMLTHVR